MVIVSIVLGIIVCLLSYVVFNLLRKLEFYEQQIEEFYSALSVTLHSMRALDARQIFEDDDEVGSVFKQLSDIVSTLHPLLYGTPDEKEEN